MQGQQCTVPIRVFIIEFKLRLAEGECLLQNGGYIVYLYLELEDIRYVIELVRSFIVGIIIHDSHGILLVQNHYLNIIEVQDCLTFVHVLDYIVGGLGYEDLLD